MAIECGQCPKTFRTQNGKEWHAQHIHSDLPIGGSSGHVYDYEFEENVECLIVEQVNNLSSSTSEILDQREAGVLADVKRMIANSDQLLRAHIEQRVGEMLQEVTAIHREPAKAEDESDPLAPYLREREPANVVDEPRGLATWLGDTKATKPVKVVEMACEYSTTSKSCSMSRGHQRPRYSARLMGVPTDEMIRDALEFCGYAFHPRHT